MQDAGSCRHQVDPGGVRRFVRCALAVLSVLSATAWAESPGKTAQSTEGGPSVASIDTVTVEAQRQRELLERQISTFVTEIAHQSRNDSLARWQLPICPLVAGLTLEKGTFVFQRVSRIASEAGIPLGPPECNPNLLIVMTKEPEAFLERWWGKQTRLFNQDRGIASIKRTIRTPAPVRVFYNACSVPPGMAKTFGQHVLSYCGVGTLGSRLTWDAVRVLYTVIVVVDLGKTQAIEIGALTDYVAMKSLAHIRSDADVGTAPTILRLFDESGAARPLSMSVWDQTFLRSLYATDSGNTMQLSDIKFRMQSELVR